MSEYLVLALAAIGAIVVVYVMGWWLDRELEKRRNSMHIPNPDRRYWR